MTAAKRATPATTRTPTARLWPPPGEWGIDEYADAVCRAAEVLGEGMGVTGVSVFPCGDRRAEPRVHVTVDHPDRVRVLADLRAKPRGIPAFSDHATDPTWVGWTNGIWLFVGVDMDCREQR